MLQYVGVLVCVILVLTHASENKDKYSIVTVKNQYTIGKVMNSGPCEFVHNNKVKYVYNGEKEPENLPANTTARNCMLRFEEIRMDQAGTWQVRGLDWVMDYMIFVGKEKQEMDVQPRRFSTADVNETLIFFMPKTPEKTTGCLLVHENPVNNATHEVYNITEMKSGNKVDFLQPQYECGVKIKFKSESIAGKWMLLHFVEGDKIYFGSFEVGIGEPLILEEIQKFAILDTEFVLEIGYPNILRCDLVNPRGKEEFTFQDRCQYKIPRVSLEDSGVWTFYFTSTNTYKTYKQEIIIEVHDHEVQTSVEDGSSTIHLLCYMKYDTETQFCNFEHPNGTIYTMYNSIGHDKYEYYTNASDTDSISKYCGLTIRSPDESDYGVWKCQMKVTPPAITVGSILHVGSQKEKSDQVTDQTSNIYVKENNAFKISCTTNEKIKNCWLMSPTGALFVVNEKRAASDLEYLGRGFSMGDCGAIVANASSDHHGYWKCQIKLQNNKRVESRISVTVAKSAIIAKQDNIIYTGAPITMSCAVIPSETFDFDVCRWIKPDGNGIHYESDQRYQLESNHRECNLLVSDDSVVGQWTCVLKTSIGAQEVYSADIRVYGESPSNVLTIAGSLGLCLIFFISCLTFYVCRRRIKNRRTAVLELR